MPRRGTVSDAPARWNRTAITPAADRCTGLQAGRKDVPIDQSGPDAAMISRKPAQDDQVVTASFLRGEGGSVEKRGFTVCDMEENPDNHHRWNVHTIDKAEGAMGKLLNAELANKDVCSFATIRRDSTKPSRWAATKMKSGAAHAESDAGNGAAVGLGTGPRSGGRAGPPGAAVARIGPCRSLVGALHGLTVGTEEKPARGRRIVVAVRIESEMPSRQPSPPADPGAIYIERVKVMVRRSGIDFDLVRTRYSSCPHAKAMKR